MLNLLNLIFIKRHYSSVLPSIVVASVYRITNKWTFDHDAVKRSIVHTANGIRYYPFLNGTIILERREESSKDADTVIQKVR
ncbi:hypothetical protein [Paenibacillus aquistagni]|uniref:hypothetical protein n=1 Tax=Paenibacillus aquistagni TaxID=1852522 RepID=UPI00145AC100|nr:hypothetical protein [Paenibacillus aquistagni]NMM53970.1 hypothetical protein [Paenibacillus aquistagni]